MSLHLKFFLKVNSRKQKKLKKIKIKAFCILTDKEKIKSRLTKKITSSVKNKK